VTEPKKVKLGLFLIGSIVVAAAALLSFGWLAEEMLESETRTFDDAVRAAIHRLASPEMTRAMQVFSFLGSGTLLVALSLLTIVTLFYIHRPRAAHLMGITMSGAVAVDLVLKQDYTHIWSLP
jgi:undecaprenyl-diphosphatase